MLVISLRTVFLPNARKRLTLKQAQIRLPLSISWYFGFNKVMITSTAWSATLEDLKLDNNNNIIVLYWHCNNIIITSFPQVNKEQDRNTTSKLMQHTCKTFCQNMVSFIITVTLKSKLPPSSHKTRNGSSHDLNQKVYNYAIHVLWEIMTCKGHLLCDSHGAKRI